MSPVKQQKFSEEFYLNRDLTVNDVYWILDINKDHNHHSMRVGYQNGEGFKELLHVDSEGNIHFHDVKEIIDEGNLESYLRKDFPEYDGSIPKGKTLYIEATGIKSSETQMMRLEDHKREIYRLKADFSNREASDLIETYRAELPRLLEGKLDNSA